jgi:hypothetical protein
VIYSIAAYSTFAAAISMLLGGLFLLLFFAGAGGFFGPLNDLFTLLFLVLLLPAVVVTHLVTTQNVGVWSLVVLGLGIIGITIAASSPLLLLLGVIRLETSFLVAGGCSSLPIEVTVRAASTLRRERFAAQIEGAAYFLVVEALANTLKHARATHATVTLARRERRLSLSVADDGTGFDPAVTERRGLAGLEDRFAALGGHVHIASRPGAGTRVTASLPVEP